MKKFSILAFCALTAQAQTDNVRRNKPTTSVAKSKTSTPAAKTTRPTRDVPNGHEWVDLGLPSGTLWSTHNIGAKRKEDIGYYYSWGELDTKKGQYVNSTYTLDYVFVGNDISGTIYDVALYRWGSPWQMPTKEDVDELCSYCAWREATINGTTGIMGMGPSGATIFFPPSGYMQFGLMNTVPLIWTSTYLDTDGSGAWAGIMETRSRTEGFGRRFGLPVRPVIKKNR